MKITKKMIDEFNSIYFPFSTLEIVKTGTIGCWELKVNSPYINFATISPSDKFYKSLKEYFDEIGMELDFNNTGNIFWAKN